MELHWTDHLLFLIIGVLIPARAIFGAQPQLADITFTPEVKRQLYWGNSLYLALLALAVLGVWWFNGRPWALLGITRQWIWPTGIALAALFIFMLVYVWDTAREVRQLLSGTELDEGEQRFLGFLPANMQEYAQFLVLCASAGIFEELVFRGYFIRYFQALLYPLDPTFTLALVVPALVFGLVHLYQGWESVVKIAAMAVLFGYVFLLTQSLWTLMLVHALVDAVGGWLSWKLLSKKS